MLRIACLLMLIAFMPGCGNKGPLFLPSNPQAGTQSDSNQQIPRK